MPRRPDGWRGIGHCAEDGVARLPIRNPKSSILRAIGWLFNGTALSEDDVRAGANPRQITIEGEFRELNEDAHSRRHRLWRSGLGGATGLMVSAPRAAGVMRPGGPGRNG